jgi:hypothetical protein
MPNGTYLNRDAILKADDLKREEVEVPEWGGKVLVRELTGLERQEFDGNLYSISQKIKPSKRKGGKAEPSDIDIDFHSHQVRVRLCAMTIIDSHGNRMFDDEDVSTLGRKSAKALQRVYDVAARLSGISAEEEAESDAVGESVGAGTSETSTSSA